MAKCSCLAWPLAIRHHLYSGPRRAYPHSCSQTAPMDVSTLQRRARYRSAMCSRMTRASMCAPLSVWLTLPLCASFCRSARWTSAHHPSYKLDPQIKLCPRARWPQCPAEPLEIPRHVLNGSTTATRCRRAIATASCRAAPSEWMVWPNKYIFINIDYKTCS